MPPPQSLPVAQVVPKRERENHGGGRGEESIAGANALGRVHEERLYPRRISSGSSTRALARTARSEENTSRLVSTGLFHQAPATIFTHRGHAHLFSPQSCVRLIPYTSRHDTRSANLLPPVHLANTYTCDPSVRFTQLVCAVTMNLHRAGTHSINAGATDIFSFSPLDVRISDCLHFLLAQ